MKKLFTFLTLCVSLHLFAQTNIQVKDEESHQPIEYASILLPKYKQRIVTDRNGKIELDQEKYTFPLEIEVEQFSYFSTKYIVSQPNQNHIIELKADSDVLEEIIIPPSNKKIKQRIFGRESKGSGKILGSFKNFDNENKKDGIEFGLIINTNDKFKKLTSINWHIKDFTFKKAVFAIELYETYKGIPSKRINHKEIKMTISDTKNDWYTLDVSDLDIYIDGYKKIAVIIKTLDVVLNKEQEGELILNVGLATSNQIIARDSYYEDWLKLPFNYPFFIVVDSYE